MTLLPWTKKSYLPSNHFYDVVGQRNIEPIMPYERLGIKVLASIVITIRSIV